MTEGIDRTTVTFAQAEGLEPLPRQLEKENVPEHVRIVVWSAFYTAIQNSVSWHDLSHQWVSTMGRVFLHYFHVPTDEYEASIRFVGTRLKKVILDGAYSDFYGLIQFIARDPDSPRDFIKVLAKYFEEQRLAYRLDVKTRPYTFWPVASEVEHEVLKNTASLVSQHGFDGAATHLANASQELTQGNYGKSVSESIHAVESTCKRVAGTTKGGLKDALTTLKNNGVEIHHALHGGFTSLYGYASDEEGVRHALVFQGAAKVDETDAVYMLGACASFITFVINKALAVGLIE